MSKPLFSNRKINSFKISKDLKYFNKVYKRYLPGYEKEVLEKDIMKMKFILDKNIHDLKYLSNYNIDKNVHGFYSLCGLGNVLASVQKDSLVSAMYFYQTINMFVLLRDDDIEVDLLRKILIKKVLPGESKNTIVKYYKNTTYYTPENLDSITDLLNMNVFEVIKSMCQDNSNRSYKNLMEKFVSVLPDLINQKYKNNMFLYKNIVTDKKEECSVHLVYSMIFTLHSRPKLYIGISLTHMPYIFVHLNNVQYVKTLFLLFQVIGDDMKMSLYEYYTDEESNNEDQYKLLLDIDLKNTKYYNSIFLEIKSHFYYTKNEKMSLISSY